MESRLDPFPQRFDRQVRFAGLGIEGQTRLAQARVLMVGCGALGGSLALYLHRAGVGELRLVDRDVVEPTNLPRQVLFDERHASERVPKVEAAAETLARGGGPTRVVPHARHLDARLLDELGRDVDLILDGTDNLATRYLVNDFAVRDRIPWIYGGVVGAGGMVMPIVPGHGPCLRCLFPQPAPPGSLETCDTAGVILPAVAAIAALQAGLALRLLGADEQGRASFKPALVQIDVWRGETHRIEVNRQTDCPCCGDGQYEFLESAELQEPTVLCGRNTVQLPASAVRPDLTALEQRLERAGARSVRRAGPLLRFGAEECEVTLFGDGRALIEGTEEPARAQAIYDRFLGA
ncbi:ThiF family adenylyltransferase [Engelhardtia mirabilis]|uniref:Molybdopterin-synthase adenylyltransferase n=1 Tax=Engelhardtia mirabilis TaxID=2528011 RepID=A0A518BJZ8_9BACT|nr:Molybdopterin-synthase adenylyltransferase [Planctomycetes bacterium Pla133]QDV01625.1 Molybdopterin-synthase adenylyltransferase [Planctomycetes bacterium Pla86]